MLRCAPGHAGAARDALRGRGAQSLFKDDRQGRIDQPRARALRLARLQAGALGDEFRSHVTAKNIHGAVKPDYTNS